MSEDEFVGAETADLLWETGEEGYTDTVHIDESRDPATLRICVGGRCVQMPLRDWVAVAWDEDGHTLDYNGRAWAAQHPRQCRPDLLTCEVHRKLMRADEQIGKLQPGRYRIVDDGKRSPLRFEALA